MTPHTFSLPRASAVDVVGVMITVVYSVLSRIYFFPNYNGLVIPNLFISKVFFLLPGRMLVTSTRRLTIAISRISFQIASNRNAVGAEEAPRRRARGRGKSAESHAEGKGENWRQTPRNRGRMTRGARMQHDFGPGQPIGSRQPGI